MTRGRPVTAGAAVSTTPARPPAAPFGSYRPDDVTWLLTDLSLVPLERPTEDREAVIQGGGHYAEMLPVEYQPEAAYLSLFHEALGRSAERVALAVGIVAERAAARLPPGVSAPVLVSLARAGTPVGILLRRWYALTRGVLPPHYTISIIRSRGIDVEALRYILDRHPGRELRFVDGWTGKGAIARELAAALDAAGRDDPRVRDVDPELAVVADPGSCTSLFGTREDYLIPSACLNSTVSGLVSRTVLRPDLIGPGMFHGAKYYAELAPADVSRVFLDAVCERMTTVVSRVSAAASEGPAQEPTWAGWAAVEQIARDHGISDLTLVKPGVGETTRVLLRRVPWQVLVRPDRADDLEHVLLLAAERGVPVVLDPTLPYSCVGLIRPRSRGA